MLGIRHVKAVGVKDEADRDDIKAVRREITNVYTKGTYNPGKSSGEKEVWSRNPGKWRYRDKFKGEETEEPLPGQDVCNPGTKFDDRYIVVFVRA